MGMAPSVSWIGTVNACFCILDQEANDFQTPDKPTIFLVSPEDGTPEPEEPIPAKQIPALQVFSSHQNAYNEEAVSIRDTLTRRGLGVFANMDFERGHNIIAERPAITCTHWPASNGAGTITEEWCALPKEDQRRLQAAFCKPLRCIPTGRETLSWLYRKSLERFVLEYAFCNPQRSLAHIYVLGSHMNHACRSCANAQQWTESDAPHRIIVKLVKPVKAGEEIFINYNRRQADSFGCAVCGPQTRMDKCKSFCERLFGRFPGFTANEDEAPQATTVDSASQVDTQTASFSTYLMGSIEFLRDKAIATWHHLFPKEDNPTQPTPSSPKEQ
ncbi:hypothetical protein TARUN_2719 [Trichoderma arundinaceum]|uniref:SET domain-containing protein n=1 Tax=Trichoderma arundinaceum TaxID=490622 RepID=A0A395NTV4_TRIAR|nr:hypothetical protein TARUN_2719 [Trichoderma arundinaceum]